MHAAATFQPDRGHPPPAGSGSVRSEKMPRLVRPRGGRRNGAISVEERTDEDLFQAYRRGEQSALRTIIERYHDDLLRFLLRLVGDRAAAEDVFQDTFLQIHLSASTFDARRKFRPWLFTIAANKGRDLLRKNSRRRAIALSTPVGGPGDGEKSGELVDLLALDLPGPEEGLERADLERQVQRAIDRLSPVLREVLLLAYFQKFSYAQIADQLGVPLGTVKSRLHSAVATFAREWSELRAADKRENTAGA